jgi:hypothetical protein
MHEALVLAQSATANLDPLERDASFQELNMVLQQISRREIEAFCGVCQFRGRADQPAAGAPAVRSSVGQAVSPE